MAIMLTGGLAACGGGGDFKAKMTEACNKDKAKFAGPDGDCPCAIDVMDAELDDETKKLIVAALVVQEDPSKAKQAMQDAGIDDPKEMADKMRGIGAKMEALESKINDKCKKA